MLFPLSIAFGALVGFALGLTGGGGSLLAVPLLVYGLALAPRDAFGVSLAAVGATALVGVVPRIRAGQVEVGTGVMFAVAGMIGAPFGTWTAGLIPETMLLTSFSLLMLVVAWRMWKKSQPTTDNRIERPDLPANGGWQTSIHVALCPVADVAWPDNRISFRHVRCRRRLCDCASIGIVQRDADSQSGGYVAACDRACQHLRSGVSFRCWS